MLLNKYFNTAFIFTILFFLLANCIFSQSNEKPFVFPIPLYMEETGGNFNIDSSTVVILTQNETKAEKQLNYLLNDLLVNKYQFPLKNITESKSLPAGKYFLLGTIDNPLVNQYCKQNKLTSSLKELGKEGYVLSITGKSIVVAANTKYGALYGFETLRQLIRKEAGRIYLPQLLIKDKPQYSFRGIKLYLPGRENIQFFKRFVKNFVALYKFNKIILELNANMQLDRHPELNIAAVRFAKMLNYSRRNRPAGPHDEYLDSSHQDVADGEVLSQVEVADLVKYIRSFNIEVIPELPSLTHSYYLLGGHKNLALDPQLKYPDSYNPLNPEIYKIYFDVLDEYIKVIHPKLIHVGHDEWRDDISTCEQCKGKDWGLMYANDLIKIHNYLAKKGIKIAIWGDHLMESVRGKGFRTWKTHTGYVYHIPGALTPEQVKKLIPKDILIFNWFWYDINNDKQISKFGFKQVYGNLRPDIADWSQRKTIPGVLGGAPSSWAATTEMNIGKDLLYDFLGCSNLLWSKHQISLDSLAFLTQFLMPNIRLNLSGKNLPSDDGLKVKPVNINSNFNSSLSHGTDSINTGDIITGKIKSGNFIFNLPAAVNGKRAVVVETQKGNLVNNEVKDIPINEDVSSIIFLQACTKPAANRKAYTSIYNFNESAQLLGWYQVVYEDGFTETIPIRYGINILDWQWRQRILSGKESKIKYNQDKYAYEADAVSCSNNPKNPITFFAFEWKNNRFGKKIKEINLKAVDYKKNNENSIVLLAVSVTGKLSGIKKAIGKESE